jgi:hypothetical protein
MEGLIYQEWLDYTTLINGRVLVWYFDFDQGEIATTII